MKIEEQITSMSKCENTTGHWSACACAGAGGGPSCAPRQRAGPPARRGSRGLHSPGEGLLFSYDQFSGSSPLGFIAIFFTKKLQLVSPARQRAPAPVISAPAVSRDLCHDSCAPPRHTAGHIANPLQLIGDS